LSTPFQNRLVGTIIVAAAAIIFLPDVLDGDKQSNQADFEGIPSAPKFEKNTSSKTFPAQLLKKIPQTTLAEDVALDDIATNKSGELSTKNNVKPIKSKGDGTVKVNVLAKNQSFEKNISKVSTSNSKTSNINVSNIKASKNRVVTANKSKNKSLPEKSIASESWVIQLGSFRHKNNVNELLSKLKKNGYTAFTKPIKTKNGTLTKVFVGPALIKSSLENKIAKLKVLTNVQGKVARFYPGK